jgi:hypothetical protein
MTVHRPHPITGPWPYALHPAHELRERAGGEVGLIDRVPIEDSLIYDDPEDALLYDDCDRCAQHAEHPTASIDNESLGALWRRMVEVEKDPTYRAHYRTRTEAAACRKLYEIASFVARTHPTLEVWTWPWHLRAGHVTFALTEGVHLEIADVRFR